ncbi:MAG: DUF4145 domain-containing protein [Beijerinckiaceae bacterium]
MAILTHICPHCSTDGVGLRIAAATAIDSDNYALHLSCPKCNLPSSAVVTTTRTSPNYNFMQYAGEFTDLWWKLVGFWPDPPKPVIPELLPPDVERIYLQAERNFPIKGNEEAAGAMYGKSLDIGLKKIDPKLTGMLGQKIKKLSADGKLTTDISEWSQQIRDIRNDAVHEEDPVTREELIALRNFSEMVLRYLFTLPNAVRKRRGEKLEWEP